MPSTVSRATSFPAGGSSRPDSSLRVSRLTIVTLCPRSTSRRASSYDRVAVERLRVAKYWWK